MTVYKVTLFGHRDLYTYKKTERRLYAILQELIRRRLYIEFLLGRNGDFDTLAASVIKQVQNEMGKENVTMTLVLPYIYKDVEAWEHYYDHIMIPETVERTHPKGAISKRNEWMIDQCDLVICCVEKKSGGAYAAVEYARKIGKTIINLAMDKDFDE